MNRTLSALLTISTDLIVSDHHLGWVESEADVDMRCSPFYLEQVNEY
jgi:hypothetical protein